MAHSGRKVVQLWRLSDFLQLKSITDAIEDEVRVEWLVYVAHYYITHLASFLEREKNPGIVFIR